MKSEFVVCALLFLAVSSTAARSGVEVEFDAFVSSFGKKYDSQREYEYRREVFGVNAELIRRVNAEKRGYTLAINKFADLTFDEFKAAFLGGQECSATDFGSHPVSKKAPSKKDWRNDGIVSVVKDQGSCGSCWTFSSTGALEAAYAQKTGKKVLLSEQQLVDCAQAFDNHGCNGGLPSHAFEYIRYVGGIETETSYPYTAVDGKCVFNSSAVAVKVTGEFNVTAGAEEDLVDAVGTVRPTSVAFEVVDDFRFYSSGVYSSKTCKSGAFDVNHAVLAVGYNVKPSSGKPYWIIKNSWGESWGENGYFQMEYGKNMCGVATCASYPDVA